MMQKSDKSNASNAHYGIETFFKANGMFYFQFNGKNGVPILFSRGYQNQRSRNNGIKTFIRNAALEENYIIKNNKQGKHFFVLQTSNKQEIGRSQLFDFEEEMEEKKAVLKSIKNDISIFDTADVLKENVIESEESNKNKEEVIEEITPKSVKSAPSTVTRKTSEQEDSAQPPRYKFSIIYYPDSNVWSIIHDFSSDKDQLKTLDGQQIETFIKKHLPASEPASISTPTQLKKPTSQPPSQLQKTDAEAIELSIKTYQGEKITKFAESMMLDKIEIMPKSGHPIPTQLFEAKVVARSLENNQVVLIGAASKQKTNGSRLVIPIWRANALKPGAYLFIVQIHQNRETKQSLEYYGSQLLILS